MLCTSTAFAVVRSLAGCLSVTFVYCVETDKDTATVAMECKHETVPKLSNGTIFSDLERLLSQFLTLSQKRHDIET